MGGHCSGKPLIDKEIALAKDRFKTFKAQESKKKAKKPRK